MLQQRSKRHLFVGPDASSHAAVFRSSDRQTLIHSILQAAYTDGGAGLGGVSPLSDSILKMFPLHMYARLMELRNDWLTFWREPMTRESSSRLDRLSEMNADQFLSGRSSMDTVMSSMQEGGDSGTVVTGSVASGEVGVDMAGGASAAQPTKGAPSAPEQPEGEGASESKRHSNASGESEATAVTHITWSTAKSRGTTTTVTSGNLAHAGDGGGASSRCGGTGSERKSAATGDACSTSTSQSKQRRRRRRKKFCGCLKRFCGSALYQVGSDGVCVCDRVDCDTLFPFCVSLWIALHHTLARQWPSTLPGLVRCIKNSAWAPNTLTRLFTTFAHLHRVLHLVACPCFGAWHHTVHMPVVRRHLGPSIGAHLQSHDVAVVHTLPGTPRLCATACWGALPNIVL